MNNQEILLASNRKSDWRIVTPESPTFLTARAAEELQHWIGESSGCLLPIVTCSEPEGDCEIVLDGARACRGTPHPLLGGANDEDYVLYADDRQIYIAGSGLRGTLYGAYAFLENYLGVRFLTADHTYVPKRTVLSICAFNDYEKPLIPIRIEPFRSARDVNFAGRARINLGPAPQSEPEKALGYAYPYSYGHSIADIVPDEMFARHPDFFPEWDGCRHHGQWHQRCLTHPAVLEMAIQWAKAQLRAHPDRRMLAIGQNDTYPDQPNNCQCPACRAIDEEEGSPMGSLLRFVNAVAEAIEPEFPDVIITTLAYRYTRKPPKITRPRHNVAIILCSIECCFSHPMTANCGSNYSDGAAGSVSNEAFVADIEGWSAISEHLLIWDYVTDFAHYIAPHPNLRAIGPNMRFFYENKACGVYPEGSHDIVGAEMDELRTYMLCRLMWNPYCDWEEDMQEFLVGTLGVAAVPVLKYINMLHDHVEKNHIHMSTYHAPDEIMFPLWLLDEADRLFARAETLAKDDDALRLVRKMYLSVRYVRLFLHGPALPADQRKQLAADFLQDMQECGVDGLHEGGRSAAEQHLSRILKLD